MVEQFLNLPKDATYRLSKKEAKKPSMVYAGEFVEGKLTILETNYGAEDVILVLVVPEKGFNYIRTSVVKEVLDSSETCILFETINGGVYELEKL